MSVVHLVMASMSELACVNWKTGVLRQQMRYLSFTLLLFITQAKTSKLTEKQLQYAGTSWEELKHIRQAIGFLVNPFRHLLSRSLRMRVKLTTIINSCSKKMQVIHQKPKKTLDEISHDLCPVR